MADIRRNDGGYGEGIMSSGGSTPGTWQGKQYVLPATGAGEVLQPEWIGQGSHRPGIGFERNGYCIWCNCPVSAPQCNAPVKVHMQASEGEK